MGTPITYLSGGTMGYQSGVFKNATTALGFTFPLTSGYRWWNGVDTSSSQYLLYSDIHSVGQSTVANGRPTAWSTPDLTDQSLLNLINTLPERVGKGQFTSIFAALEWLQSTGTYFLIRNGLENIVQTSLRLYYDSGWYTSYAGSGTAVGDLSGNGRTGTLTNGTSFISNGVASFLFDGTDDEIQINSQVLSGSDSFTVNCWIQSDPSEIGGTVFGNYPAGNLQIFYGSSFMGMWLNNDSTYVSDAPSFFKTAPVMITAVRSGSTTYFYQNGFLLKQGSSSSSIGNTTDFRLGVNTENNEEFTGKISITQVYGIALTAEQIFQNYNAQKGRFGITSPVQNGMVLELDAANPTSYPGTGTAWTDISGYANNGTLTNGPTFSAANGGAIVFDGTNDSVEIPGTFGTYANYTICYWAVRDANDRMPVASRTTTQFYWFGDNSWKYNHGGTNGEFYYPKNIEIGLGSWGHLCVVYNGSNVSIYRQGIYQGQQATTGTANWSEGMKLGWWSAGGNYAWLGKISNVLFYDQALTAAQIQQNFYAYADRYGVGIVRNGLVLNVDAGNFASYPTSGTTWYDLSGSVFDGTLINGPSYSSSQGGLLNFDGSDDYVNTGQSIASEQFTICAWFKCTNASTYRMIVSKESSGGVPWNYRLFLDITTGNLIGDVANSNGYSSVAYLTNLANNSWYHAVFVRNTSVDKLFLYVNGVEVKQEVDNTVGSITNSQEVWIGRSFYSGGIYPFLGSIAQVQIYNRPLSAGEISTNYNADKARYGL